MVSNYIFLRIVSGITNFIVFSFLFLIIYLRAKFKKEAINVNKLFFDFLTLFFSFVFFLGFLFFFFQILNFGGFLILSCGIFYFVMAKFPEIAQFYISTWVPFFETRRGIFIFLKFTNPLPLVFTLYFLFDLVFLLTENIRPEDFKALRNLMEMPRTASIKITRPSDQLGIASILQAPYFNPWPLELVSMEHAVDPRMGGKGPGDDAASLGQVMEMRVA